MIEPGSKLQFEPSMQEKYKERNKEIYAFYKDGLSYRKIASMFNLSYERIRQLVHKEQAKIDRLEAARKREERINSGEIPYSFFDALVDTRIQLNLSENLEVRVYNCLSRAGIIQDICDGRTTLNDYSDEDLLSIRNFGTESLSFVRQAYLTWEAKRALYSK